MAKRGGRPPFKATAALKTRVMRLRADGWSKERIARLLKTDHETLQKHFSNELEHGADIRTDALLEYAEKAAKRGSQASIKWLSERYEAARAAEQMEGRTHQPTQPEVQAQPKQPALGKKEQRVLAATEGAGIFETPSPPPIKH